MILPLFRKKIDSAPVYAVYNVIVAQSRQPQFYAEWGVPDTFTGRFDMIGVHMALLFRRLRGDDAMTKEFSQAVFDLFFKDLDRTLREMGVGDLSMAKRIQKMNDVFFGLLTAVSEALDSGDEAALEAVLARNIYAGIADPPVAALADYVRREAQLLDGQRIAEIVSGTLSMNAAA